MTYIIFCCTALLTNLLIMFNSSVIVFFQGRNGQTGLPGPVGPKGNQVNILIQISNMCHILII